MLYDNKHTAQYMAEQYSLESTELKAEVKRLKLENTKLIEQLEKLKKHLEFIEKLP
jgi:cell division protein FtsB